MEIWRLGDLAIDLEIRAAGDSALVVELAPRIDPAINAHAIAIAKALRELGRSDLLDIVPTYRSVAVYFDPLKTDASELRATVARVSESVGELAIPERPPIEVPVCYGGEYGPDLPSVARFGNCSEAEVVRLHSDRLYRVYMLGFMPGRAYMALVDPRIAVPRHPTPRLKVPAGSVGIARQQTGFGSAESPSGWQIIGRTSVQQFDLTRERPFLFEAGDTVRFVPVEP